MSRGFARGVLGVVFALALLLLVQACSRRSEARRDDPKDPSASVVPPTVTEESTGLVFTWIDAEGGYTIVESPKDVPLAGRDVVRVLDPTKDEPEEVVYIADLRNTKPDGTYGVRTMPRKEYDDIAGKRRKLAGKKTLAPTRDPPAPAGSTRADRGTGADHANPASRPPVIIYGAEWCGACHEAAAYLKKKGIRYVEKDIEADSSADREMRAALAKAGLRGGSIPVIDVKGTIMVGFSAHKIEQALAAPDRPL